MTGLLEARRRYLELRARLARGRRIDRDLYDELTRTISALDAKIAAAPPAVLSAGLSAGLSDGLSDGARSAAARAPARRRHSAR